MVPRAKPCLKLLKKYSITIFTKTLPETEWNVWKARNVFLLNAQNRSAKKHLYSRELNYFFWFIQRDTPPALTQISSNEVVTLKNIPTFSTTIDFNWKFMYRLIKLIPKFNLKLIPLPCLDCYMFVSHCYIFLAYRQGKA